MKRWKQYLSLALALVLCMSFAACGETTEDYGDDGSDNNFYDVPDSIEGLVKDSEQMADLYLLWRRMEGRGRRHTDCRYQR